MDDNYIKVLLHFNIYDDLLVAKIKKKIINLLTIGEVLIKVLLPPIVDVIQHHMRILVGIALKLHIFYSIICLRNSLIFLTYHL